MAGSVLVPIRLLLGVAVLAVCFAGRPAILSAQNETVDQAAWKRGYNGFALLCRSMELRIEKDIRAWRSVDPERRLLIVLGSTRDIPVDVIDYIERGGAALIASDQHDYRTFSRYGVVLNRGPQFAARREDRYLARKDCPLITDFRAEHSATTECELLVSNRPGHLAVIGHLGRSNAMQREIVAWMPPLVSSRSNRRSPRVEDRLFLVSVESNAGARVLFVADQSLFSNQMMTCGDNAKFAFQTLKWLSDGDRNSVLIVTGGEVVDPMNPDMMEVLLPAPDPEEVMAALEQLPPEALIAFADSVVTAVEDEGVFDELITHLVHELPYQLYLRALILLVTILAIAFFCVRLFNCRSESHGRWKFGRGRRVRSMLERRQAAILLLAQFRASVTGNLATPWKVLLAVIRLRGDRRGTKFLRREISAAARRVQLRPRNYWTKRRLQKLQQQVSRWQQLHAQGVLEYDSSVEGRHPELGSE